MDDRRLPVRVRQGNALGVEMEVEQTGTDRMTAMLNDFSCSLVAWLGMSHKGQGRKWANGKVTNQLSNVYD